MSQLFDLKNRVVIITGAAGQLGAQYTQALVEHGARVAALDLFVPEEAIEHDQIFFLQADVTSRDSLQDALKAIRRRWETPFGLINNAAMDSPPDSPPEENGPFETYPEESWDKVMNVNAKGPMLACQVFGQAMADAGGGSIVNVCSTYGMVSPDQRLYQYRREEGDIFYKPVAYCVSKSSLLNLTRYLSTYWGPSGVRVNTLSLGGVFNSQDERFLKNYTDKTPLGRMANETEYNGAVVFLMSDASAYMTGANLVMDGGWTAW